MLRLMRKHTKSTFIKIVLGAIVVVFMFWGVGSFREQRANRIAAVNGNPITYDEFRNTYNDLFELYRRQYGDRLDDNLLKVLKLKKQALDRLISQRLMVQEAKKLGLRVRKEELIRAIQDIPAFKKDGRFDQQTYLRALSHYGTAPQAFEESVQKDILITKVQRLILNTVKVSDAEALEAFKEENVKVDIDFVAFRPASVEDPKLTQEAIEAYFSKHTDQYKTPEKVKARYLSFPFKEFEKDITITENEIQNYYELNKGKFSTPETVKARHILFKVSEDASPEQVGAIKKKALKVLKEIREGGDFAALARKYSEGPTKDRGGDLGTFPRGSMVKPFEDVVFSLAPGRISDPVRTRFGWHIMKVEKVNAPTQTPLDKVQEEIRKSLVNDGAKITAFEKANKIYEECAAACAMVDVATDYKLQLEPTVFFAENEQIPGIKTQDRTNFARTAFALQGDDVSALLELSDGYYILQLIDKKNAQVPELKDVDKRVRQDLLREEKKKAAREAAEQFLAALKNGDDFYKSAKKKALDVASTGPFKRGAQIPEIGYAPSVSETAFLLSGEKPFPEDVLEAKGEYLVIHFKKKEEAKKDAFSSEKATIKARILNQKRQETFGRWLAVLKKKGEIIYYQEDFLDS
ncbi:MAG: SurA N-terminal domain-containing protein [Deltaproteobacteria bacterium]|nr:SurA N-terminal domain-containing protein [Deltaproteobacteria bacterium]